MRPLYSFFNKIIGRFRRKPSRPEDIPKKLSAETLEKAVQEARFLHTRHAVDVTPLTKGEMPGLPRRADKN